MLDRVTRCPKTGGVCEFRDDARVCSPSCINQNEISSGAFLWCIVGAVVVMIIAAFLFFQHGQ